MSVVFRLGLAQTMAWASTYYLPAVLAAPIARDLGLSPADFFALFSLSLVVAASVGPVAGRWMDRYGGKPVLAATSVWLALCLAAMAQATAVWQLLLAWLGVGVGIASGLYEAAFATLVRLYGTQAQRSITGVTLIAGFASTLGWPLTAYVEVHHGWRMACSMWAVVHVLVCVPLYVYLPTAPAADSVTAPQAQPTAVRRTVDLRMLLLSFVFAVTGFIGAAMAAHLPGLLQAAGLTAAAAILVGMLVGPAQVVARLLEFIWFKRLPPMRSAQWAVALHPMGAALLLLAGAPAACVFGALHGAGNGLLTIVKGTLPLAIFGPHGYGVRQGALMVPARLAQALAPWLFGLVLAQGAERALLLTTVLGLLAWAALNALQRLPAEPAQL